MLAKKKILDLKKKSLSDKKLAEARFFAKSPIRKRWHKVLFRDINKPFRIYNGRKYIGLLVSISMVGFKFGEFIFTRRVSDSVHARLLKTKKNKKK